MSCSIPVVVCRGVFFVEELEVVGVGPVDDGFCSFGVLMLEFHHWWCALKSPTMIALSGRGYLAMHRSIVRSSLSGACDFSL
jgi:hypothetical protein